MLRSSSVIGKRQQCRKRLTRRRRRSEKRASAGGNVAAWSRETDESTYEAWRSEKSGIDDDAGVTRVEVIS